MSPTNKGHYMRDYYHKNKDKFNNKKEKKKRAARNRARRKVKNARGAAAIKGKDVHHKKPLRNGVNNSLKNLGILSKSKNRANNNK